MDALRVRSATDRAATAPQLSTFAPSWALNGAGGPPHSHPMAEHRQSSAMLAQPLVSSPVHRRTQTGNLGPFVGRSVEAERDFWQEGEPLATEVVRIHTRPRRALFTLLRVSGAPPGRSLTPARVTKGIFWDTDEPFTWTDTWTARSTAHQWLKRPWTGCTTFLKRSKWSEQ